MMVGMRGGRGRSRSLSWMVEGGIAGRVVAAVRAGGGDSAVIAARLGAVPAGRVDGVLRHLARFGFVDRTVVDPGGPGAVSVAGGRQLRVLWSAGRGGPGGRVGSTRRLVAAGGRAARRDPVADAVEGGEERPQDSDHGEDR